MMLLGGRQPDIKQIAVVTRNPQFNRLLSSILAEWKFFTVEDLFDAKVVFAERGIDLPEIEGHVVWLTPLPLNEGSFLPVPISLTRLYHLLETHFFPTPRRHIRVAMETNIDLLVDDSWQTGQLISLSDRGGRATCEREVPRGHQLTVELTLGRELFQIPSEVLYCIPAGDLPGRFYAQIGILFKPAGEEVFNRIRAFIEKICVERACAREEIRFTDPCVSWIDLLV